MKKLLPRHCDAQALIGIDEVVVIVHSNIELHPADLTGELTTTTRVIGGDRSAALVADVGRLIGREDHRMGSSNAARAYLLAVVEQRDVSALCQTAAIVGKFHAHLVFALPG